MPDHASISDRPELVRVWDPAVRLFHWTLVLAVVGALATGFLAGADALELHLISGAAAAALVGFRLTWGFCGPGPARFAGFVSGPRAVGAHVRDLRNGRAGRHLGHNPLGGWMILALLAALAALAATGTVLLGGWFKAGPAAGLSFAAGSMVREAHELVAIALLVLIVLHVGGVMAESLRLRESLVGAMIRGRKPVRPGDHALPVARARPVLAAVAVTVLIGGTVAATIAQRGRPIPGAPVGVAGTAYDTACSECHMAYPPSLLPAAGWSAMMTGLDDHFGEDASLPDAERAEILAFLTAHSAETADTLPAHMGRVTDRAEPLRITATPSWRRRHADLPDSLFARPPIGARSNCAACHADAATGWFWPGAIAIPAPTTKGDVP